MAGRRRAVVAETTEVAPTAALRAGRGLRFGPAAVALVVVVGFVAVGALGTSEARTTGATVWRPLVTIASIMVITEAISRLGVAERLATALAGAAGMSTRRLFVLTFALSAACAVVLNNDAAVLLLIPVLVPLVGRLHPDQPEVTTAFALTVFMAAGVAPMPVSNPMNLIVAEHAEIGFIPYVVRMIPVALAGWLVAFAVLHVLFGRTLQTARMVSNEPIHESWRAKEVLGVVLGVAVLIAYPTVALLGGPIHAVALAGAACALVLCAVHGAGRPRAVAKEAVAWDILVFLVAVSAAAVALTDSSVVQPLAGLYHDVGIGGVAAVSAVGSALVNNHPMSLVNMLAIDAGSGRDLGTVLAALVGGDLGPRMLPAGSLAGLLWFAALGRVGVHVPVRRFCRVGVAVTVPSLVASVAVLALVT